MSSEHIRSFIAIDLDDEAIKKEINRVQRDLEQTGAQLKLVDPKIMHFTFRFLGETSTETIEKVKKAMNELAFERFDITINGIGAFPNLRRINVIWVGVSSGVDRLEQLFQQLEPKLLQIGITSDDKGFNPHLTIARVKSSLNRDALATYVSKFEAVKLGAISVSSLRLKKSTLTPKGPIYSTMHEVTAS
ncbi:MAG TPA: RNA 2',3'-cyclic phosphodiesterase [Candidatus Bathyarchaeia archaeon]|nr:RNA 2',3'-cyclic phosphodiesterase [Candidatus Bathyarchaeia archaeon]